jgi:CelD/BcsL family acetyltransferase involved in cellulose biosynthesis
MEPHRVTNAAEGSSLRPAASANHEWEAATFTLHFTVGHRRIAKRMKARLLRNHFTSLSGNPDEIRMRFEEVPSDVDAIVMRSFPVETAPATVASVSGAYRYVPAVYPRYYTSLEGTFEEYLATFSAKTRSTLKRKVKKFASASGDTIEFKSYRGAAEIDEFYSHAAPLSRLTYQDRLLNAGLPSTPEFVAEMKAAAARDAVRAYLLMKDGKPVAYLYCPVDAGVVLYQYLGYDPEFAGLSCGTVLQYLAFEQLFAEPGLRLFDFTEGEGEHKKLYATHQVLCADIYYFRRTARNRLLIGLHGLSLSATKFASRSLQRLGIKSAIKRYLRRG